MKALLVLVAASALLGCHASTPTSFIDLHLVTSFNTGSIESTFLFRVPAAESNFAGSPPKAPKWASHTALSIGDGQSGYPSHRLMLPPDKDSYLCNEADGISDYTDPAGNDASKIFDPDTLLSGFEGSYIIVPRGECSFEAKSRSAQRLGAAGVIVRNTLESRYGLVDEEDSTSNTGGSGPAWSQTKWPKEYSDFECGTHSDESGGIGWRAEIETSTLDFSPPPYDASTNDLLLTGSAVNGNLCAKQEDAKFEKQCPSQRCLLTGRNASDDGSTLEACCAWDNFLRMGTDGNDGDSVPEEEEEDITIPALFVTMEYGDELYDLILDANTNTAGESVQFMNVIPYARWYPSVHYSSIAVWVLTMFALWISAYSSAKEYRYSWKKISKAISDGVLVFQRSATNSNTAGRERAETEDTVDLNEDNVEIEMAQPEIEMATQNSGTTAAETEQSEMTATPAEPDFNIADSDANEDDFVGNPVSPSSSHTSSDNIMANEETSTDTEHPPPASPPQEAFENSDPSSDQQQQPQRVNLQSQSTAAAAQSMEITAFHAVVFVLAASAFLFILFFFNLYKVIRVIYGLAGSMAMNHVLILPVYNWLSSRLCGKGMSAKMQTIAFRNLPGCRGETFKWIEVISSLTSYSIGIAWIVVGLTRVQPMQNVFYWLLQDVMGVCFCVLILGLIHINTIMVASILLCLVFIYDVFYVFISPFIFGSSVMLDVATGGNNVDPNMCEKYPFDRACRGSLAPLPMLLAVPWFNDYRGGFSMIGLGDIILPGLLVSFAARFDSAKALVRKCSEASSSRSGANTAADSGTDSVGQVEASESKQHYHLGRMFKALFHGYFGPLMIAYGIGLIAAYLAVWGMQMGQPALLYLVPATLGTMFFLGWRRRELSDLWRGPKLLIKANRMVVIAGRIPQARARAERAANNDLADTSSVV